MELLLRFIKVSIVTVLCLCTDKAMNAEPFNIHLSELHLTSMQRIGMKCSDRKVTMGSAKGVQVRLSRTDSGVAQTGVYRGGKEVRQVCEGQ